MSVADLSCFIFQGRANLSEQHENDVSSVEVKRCHHILVEEDKVIRSCVRSEERGKEGTKEPVLQDGLQDTTALFWIALDENLDSRTTTINLNS